MKPRTRACLVWALTSALVSGCVTQGLQTETVRVESSAPQTTISRDGQALGVAPLDVTYTSEVERDHSWGVVLLGAAAVTLGATFVAVDLSGDGDLPTGFKIGMGVTGALAATGLLTYFALPSRKVVSDPVVLHAITPGYADASIQLEPGQKLARLAPKAAAEGSASTASMPRAAGEHVRPKVRSGEDFVVGAPQPTAYALVIGVENYRELPSPTGARADAERFATLLRESLGVPARNIRLLVDEQATRGDILGELDWLAANVPAGGRIYFYFGGHGSPDTSTGATFILPYEATLERLARTALPLSEVLDGLEQTSARDVVAFVDSCFSGTGGRSLLPEGTRPLVPVQALKPAARVSVLSASGAAEISGSGPQIGGGLFTHHLIAALGTGLADIDGDGQISLGELEAYVAPRVSRDALEAGRAQTPSLDLGSSFGSPTEVIVLWGIAPR